MDDYFQRRSRELRAKADDVVVREPLAKVSAAGRSLTLALCAGRRGPWVEIAVWTPEGSPAERRERERGRCNMLLAELDQLIAALREARARLAKAGGR